MRWSKWLSGQESSSSCHWLDLAKEKQWTKLSKWAELSCYVLLWQRSPRTHLCYLLQTCTTGCYQFPRESLLPKLQTIDSSNQCQGQNKNLFCSNKVSVTSTAYAWPWEFYADCISQGPSISVLLLHSSYLYETQGKECHFHRSRMPEL